MHSCASTARTVPSSPSPWKARRATRSPVVRCRPSTRTAPSSTAPTAADVSRPTDAVEALADRVRALGWVTDLWVAGSLATSDHVPGVSDLDLVAVVDGELSPEQREVITEIHHDLDAGVAAGT